VTYNSFLKNHIKRYLIQSVDVMAGIWIAIFAHEDEDHGWVDEAVSWKKPEDDGVAN
jgi:hypothetical protein